MMSLGGVEPGTYSIKLALKTGTLRDVRAVDSEGETLGIPVAILNPGTDEQVVTIQVKEAAYGVALWGFTRDSKVAVTYNITYAAAAAASGGNRCLGGGREEVWAVVFTSVLVVMCQFWL